MLRRPLKTWFLALAMGTVGVLALVAPEASWASVPRLRHASGGHHSAKAPAKRPEPHGSTVRQRPAAHALRRGVVVRSAKMARVPAVRRPVAWTPRSASVTRASYGTAFGLGEATDPLALKSNAALVLDQDSNETLLSKNARAVLPIASLTKLMTSVVVIEAGQDLGRMAVHQQRRHRHRERQPLEAGHRHPTATFGDAAPGLDVLREPRGQCPRASFPGWPQRLRRRHEPQGPGAGHAGHPLCRAHRLVQQQPVQRARPGLARQVRLQAHADPRVVDLPGI